MTAHNSKIANATIEDVDWSFVDNKTVMKAVEKAALKAASEWEAVEYDDALQDALLWTGIHPEIIAQYDLDDEDGRALFSYRIYSDALREKAEREYGARRVTFQHEAVFGEASA